MRYRGIFCVILLFAVFTSVTVTTVSPTQANPQANWLPTEIDLSDWQSTIYEHRLVLGQDDTLGAFWILRSGSQWSLWGRVRHPGAEWSKAINISGIHTELWDSVMPPTEWDVLVMPDGTVWAIWLTPATSTEHNLRAAFYPPGGPWQNDHPTTQSANITDVKLAASLNGFLVAAWKAYPNHLNVARRFPEAHGWEQVDKVDNGWTNTYIREFYLVVGDGGQVVVLWVEDNPAGTSEYGVFTRSYNLSSGVWSPAKGTSPISSWKLATELSQPVMSPDGSVIAVWGTKSGSPAKFAVFSSNRLVESGIWSSPVQISSTRDLWLLNPKLAIGENGTVVAVWMYKSITPTYELFVNARDPGGPWGTETNLSGSQCGINYWDVGVWPSGEAIAVWQIMDCTRPTNSNIRHYWSLRPPNSIWGGGGQGSVGDWENVIQGSDFALGYDGSAVLVWAGYDTPFFSLRAASWPPGGPWETAESISGLYGDVYLGTHGVVMGMDGRPVAAAGTVESNIGSSKAVIFNEKIFETPPPGDHKVYMPLVVK